MLAVLFAFVLGIGNFAAQRAVLASRHPFLLSLPHRAMVAARAVSLGFEFAVLVAALAAAQAGLMGWVLLYAGYSAFNAGAAWAIATGRL